MRRPVSLLTLEDMDDVVADLAVMDVKRRRPGELHAPAVKLHDQRLAWSTRHI